MSSMPTCHPVCRVLPTIRQGRCLSQAKSAPELAALRRARTCRQSRALAPTTPPSAPAHQDRGARTPDGSLEAQRSKCQRQDHGSSLHLSRDPRTPEAEPYHQAKQGFLRVEVSRLCGGIAAAHPWTSTSTKTRLGSTQRLLDLQSVPR